MIKIDPDDEKEKEFWTAQEEMRRSERDRRFMNGQPQEEMRRSERSMVSSIWSIQSFSLSQLRHTIKSMK